MQSKNKNIAMSKSLSQFITTNTKSLLFIFVIALFFSLFNLDNFKLDASSDSLVLESDDDLKYYREVNSDYSSSERSTNGISSCLFNTDCVLTASSGSSSNSST